MRTSTHASAETARCRAIEFLARGQLHSGQFNVEFCVEPKPGERLYALADQTPFVTAQIVYSLGFVREPLAQTMIARALDYFRAQQVGPGLWRYWDKGHPEHSVIPPDLDDCATISYLLERHHRPLPNNRPWFLWNRNARGLFYTWLIPRKQRTRNLRYWWQVLSDYTPKRALSFWRFSAAEPQDIDAVVNANVLLYLGVCVETTPIVDWLIELIQTGCEVGVDKWYHDVFTLYYALSRNYYAGVTPLECTREAIVQRIERAVRRDGRIGENELHTALALNTLFNFGVEAECIEPALAYLVAAQRDYGGWRRAKFYYCGPNERAWWGSEELTTGFCIEALERSKLWR